MTTSPDVLPEEDLSLPRQSTGSTFPGAPDLVTEFPCAGAPDADEAPDADDFYDGDDGFADENVDHPGGSTAPTAEVFSGDEGTMSLAQRRTLVRLLRQRYITEKGHPAEWSTLVEHVDLFRSRLHDLLLDLRLDLDRGVAFKTQIELDDIPTPRLLTDRGYTREETIILWFLRLRLRSEQSAGEEVVIVDRDDILERVETFRPPDSTDKASDRRTTEAALTRLIEAGVLKKTADDARLEIQPVLETLMPLETLRELSRTLMAANEPDAVADAGNPDEDDLALDLAPADRADEGDDDD